MRPLKATVVLALAAGLVAASAVPSFVAASADDDGAEPYYPLDTYPPSDRDNAVLQWNEEALQCVRETKPGPTVVARSLYVLHTAVYDAWAGYDAKARPTVTGGWKRQPASQRTAANKVTAVSHAAHRTLHDLFPDDRCRGDFDDQLRDLSQVVGDTGPAATEGRRAADAVLGAAHKDGSNQKGDDPRGTAGVRYSDTSGYRPVNTSTTVVDPWRWQPLGVPLDSPVAAQKALTPHWGGVRPFVSNVTKEAAQAPDPRKLSGSERQAMIDEVIHYSAGLDDRTKAIAEYWADGPESELPPGHWNLFAQWVSRRHGQSLDADAKMFFGLNGALHDAGIAAWSLKYRFDFARPVTAIREERRGQMIQAWAGPGRGTQWIRGEDWTPYQSPTFPTPPFPGYTSGHSTFSAAASAFLKDFGGLMGRDGDRFGASVTIPAGSSAFEDGVPAQDVTLRWDRFQDAADEAGISRLYGGIHWSIDDLPARDVGKKCGEAAFSLAKKYWEG